MARLAINPDWSSNAHDPRNAHYLRPLSIVADEKLANGMADATYGAVAEEHGNDRTCVRAVPRRSSAYAA